MTSDSLSEEQKPLLDEGSSSDVEGGSAYGEERRGGDTLPLPSLWQV